MEDSDKEESNHEDIIENHDEANETNDNEFEVPEIAVSPPSPRPGRKEIATPGDPLLARTPEFELELGRTNKVFINYTSFLNLGAKLFLEI